MTTEQMNETVHTNTAGDHADDVTLVLLSSIKVNESFNCRGDYTEIDELAEQIRLDGLLTPLTVDQNYNLIAGFRRKRALDIVHKGDPNALVKATVKLIEAKTDAFLINIGENTGRKNLNDFDLAKRLYELEEKHGIKRSMIQKRTGLSKSAVASLIATYTKASPTLRKAWAASYVGELKDVDDKPVVIPTSRISEWTKKEARDQAKHLDAFLDNDRPNLEPDTSSEDESGEGERSRSNGASNGKPSRGNSESPAGRAATKAEIKEYVEVLDEKKKTDGLDEKDQGRYQALRWVLGQISRPY